MSVLNRIDQDQVDIRRVLSKTPNGQGRKVLEILRKYDHILHFLSSPAERPWNKNQFVDFDSLETTFGSPEELALGAEIFAIRPSNKKHNCWHFISGSNVYDSISTGEYDVEYVGNFYDEDYRTSPSKLLRFDEENMACMAYGKILKKIRTRKAVSQEEMRFKKEFEAYQTKENEKLPTVQGVFRENQGFDKTKTLTELQETITTKEKTK